ncbi:MAG: MFS transporter [Ignavibacteriales bacterium]|nr:MFS transporter [Ignavibacteriales bacterium]
MLTPAFLFPKRSKKKTEKVDSYIKIGLNRVWTTLTHLKHYKNLVWFLLAYFFYIEGVNTVIFFSGNYASTTLGFDTSELIIFFLTVQTTAIFGSILLGILADSIGQKKTIVITPFSMADYCRTCIFYYGQNRILCGRSFSRSSDGFKPVNKHESDVQINTT